MVLEGLRDKSDSDDGGVTGRGTDTASAALVPLECSLGSPACSSSTLGAERPLVMGTGSPWLETGRELDNGDDVPSLPPLTSLDEPRACPEV
jgi:hypothetical protein